jgi:hypothetical protein
VHSIESDYDDEVLANCEKNGQLNRHLFAHEDVVRVRKLDWLAPPPAWFCASPPNAAEPAVRPAADHSGDEAAGPPYEWTQADVAECQRISVLLAADGESARGLDPMQHLTFAFFACRAMRVVRRVLCRHAVIYEDHLTTALFGLLEYCSRPVTVSRGLGP